MAEECKACTHVCVAARVTDGGWSMHCFRCNAVRTLSNCASSAQSPAIDQRADVQIYYTCGYPALRPNSWLASVLLLLMCLARPQPWQQQPQAVTALPGTAAAAASRACMHPCWHTTTAASSRDMKGQYCCIERVSCISHFCWRRRRRQLAATSGRRGCWRLCCCCSFQQLLSPAAAQSSSCCIAPLLALSGQLSM